MSFLDDVKAAKAAHEAAEHPDAPASIEDTRTVKSILNNSRESRLFATYLAGLKDESGAEILSGKGEELARKVTERSITEADFPALEKFRAEFSERMRKAESAVEALDDETVRAFAQNSKELAGILKLAGPEGVGRAIRSQMMELAIENPVAFENLNKKISLLSRNREAAHKRADEIARLAEEKGLDANRYAGILATIQDPAERKDAIRAAINENRGLMSRMIDRVSGGHGLNFFGKKIGNTGALANELRDNGTAFDNLGVFIDKSMKDVGDVLKATVIARPEILSAFKDDIFSDSKPKPALAGFQDLKRIPSFGERRPSLEAAWAKAKLDNDAKASTEKLEISALAAKFRDEQKKKFKDAFASVGGGVWAMLRQIFFGENIDRHTDFGTAVTA